MIAESLQNSHGEERKKCIVGVFILFYLLWNVDGMSDKFDINWSAGKDKRNLSHIYSSVIECYTCLPKCENHPATSRTTAVVILPSMLSSKLFSAHLSKISSCFFGGTLWWFVLCMGTLTVQGLHHTPSIAFRHLPPNSARFSYATEGALFISAQLSSDAVSALRKVPVLIWM